MDTHTIPSEIIQIGDSLLQFIEQEVVPIEREYEKVLFDDRYAFDEQKRLSKNVLDLRRRVRMLSADAGFYTMFGAEEIGGSGLGALASVYLNYLVASKFGPGRLLIYNVVIPSPFTNGLSPVLTNLAPDIQSYYLPKLASGEKTLCFALSEPDAGSDVYSIKTRAVRDGSNWIINGTKQWITNGPYADYAMIFAITDVETFSMRQGGVTGFLVDTESTGFEVVSTIPVMGQLGGEVGILSFHDLEVPDMQRLGPLNEGLKVAMRGVNAGRMVLPATCIGFARWSLDQALEYSKVRKTFGKPIAENQAIQFLISDSAFDIYAAESMLVDTARRIDAGQDGRTLLSICKAFSTEAANRVIDRCMQVHGGMGLTNDLRLEAGYRFTRLARIPDGTGEILRRNVAQNMLRNGNQI